ncbi:hypothetical protein AAZX31_15G181600 [Glycine max]
MMQIQTRQEEEGFGSGRSELSIIICLKIKILASGYSQNPVIPSILIFVEGKCGGNGIKDSIFSWNWSPTTLKRVFMHFQ